MIVHLTCVPQKIESSQYKNFNFVLAVPSEMQQSIKVYTIET